jgi:beta-aspartyl-peptidase (threonine type)
MHAMDGADPTSAVRHSLVEVEAIGGEAGGIALTRSGKFGWAHNSREFAVAYLDDKMDAPRTFVRKSEESQ